MNEKAAKLIRRHVATLKDPTQRAMAGRMLTSAWKAGSHKEREQLRAYLLR